MSNDLINIEVLKATEVFLGDKPKLPALIKIVSDKVDNFKHDMTTKKGQDATRAFAAGIGRTITGLDGLGKDYTDPIKKKTKVIDDLRKGLRADLGELKTKARKPLTDWEEDEAKRESDIQEKLQALQAMAITTISDISFLEKGLADIQETVIDDSWGKVQMQAELAKNNALDHHIKRIADLKAQAKEREELEQFRKDKADREEKERLADAESARIKREEEITKNATKKAEQEARDAKERAQQVELRRIKDLDDAKIKAEKDKQKAVEAEKSRIVAEMQHEKDEEAKRAANKKHNAKINNEAKDALVVAGLSDQAATQAVTAIAKGMIPNVTIRY